MRYNERQLKLRATLPHVLEELGRDDANEFVANLRASYLERVAPHIENFILDFDKGADRRTLIDDMIPIHEVMQHVTAACTKGELPILEADLLDDYLDLYTVFRESAIQPAGATAQLEVISTILKVVLSLLCAVFLGMLTIGLGGTSLVLAILIVVLAPMLVRGIDDLDRVPIGFAFLFGYLGFLDWIAVSGAGEEPSGAYHESPGFLIVALAHAAAFAWTAFILTLKPGDREW